MKNGETHLRCPLTFVRDHLRDYNEFMQAYNWAKLGFLPDEGTWLDQTPCFIEVFTIVSAAINETQAGGGGGTGGARPEIPSHLQKPSRPSIPAGARRR